MTEGDDGVKEAKGVMRFGESFNKNFEEEGASVIAIHGRWKEGKMCV